MASAVELDEASTSYTSESEMDDAIYEAKDLKVKLDEVIQSVSERSSGTFATSNVLFDCPNPGLTVHGLDDIGLPLPKRDAVQLLKLGHQAPFGQGSRTVVDTNVRNTCEFDANQVGFNNPAWHGYVDKILDQVATNLGIVGGRKNIDVSLYKLLFYEEGAFFKKHRDTEKEQGMFGTLVIALPSEHQGGAIRAAFQNEEKVLETAPSSAFGYSYLAWYADVEHTVDKVTSGYRLVLVYNLRKGASAEEQSAAAVENSGVPLRKLFSRWKEWTPISFSGKLPKMLCYALEHQKTEASLCLHHLKGTDARVGKALYDASRKTDFTFLLANMEYVVEGECGGAGYGIEEELESTLKLTLVVEASGSKIAGGVPIDQEDLVQEDLFGREPDEEDFEEYTGNAGPFATHWGILDTIPRPKSSHGPTGPELPYDDVGLLIKETCQLEDFELFGLALQKSVAIHHLTVYQKVGAIFQPKTSLELRDTLPKLLSYTDRFHERYATIKGLLDVAQRCPSNDLDPNDVSTIKEWAKAMLLDSFLSTGKMYKEDGPSFVELGVKSGKDFLFSTILPKAKEHKPDLAFTLAFLESLSLAKSLGTIDARVAQNIFHDTVFNLASDFRLENEYESSKRIKIYSQLHATGGDLKNTMSATDFASFIGLCYAFKLDQEVQQILCGIKTSARTIPVNAFITLLLPFLNSLEGVLVRRSVPFTTPSYQKFYRCILTLYLEHFLQRERTTVANWTRPTILCPCAFCIVLNRFLRDPSKAVGRFPGTRQNHSHLSSVKFDKSHILIAWLPSPPSAITLVKTEGESDIARSAWKSRYGEAEKKIQTIRPDALRELTNGDITKSLMSSRLLQNTLERQRPERPPAENVPSEPAAKTTRTASGAVIVDLT